MMHAAAQALLEADTMSCKLREQINLRGRTLNGIGSYLQGPKQSRWIRLELKLQAGDEITTLQQVCDGRNLWIRRELLDHPTLEHVDVTKLLAQPGQAGAPLGALIAVGGLQGLLSALDESFVFDEPSPTRLEQRDVVALHGRWKPERLARLFPLIPIAPGQRGPDVAKLPDHVPTDVVVFLGTNDKFPYRLEYRRISGKKNANPTGDPLLVMELYDVVMNLPVDPQLFHFEPGTLRVFDRTDAWLQMYGAR